MKKTVCCTNIQHYIDFALSVCNILINGKGGSIAIAINEVIPIEMKISTITFTLRLSALVLCKI